MAKHYFKHSAESDLGEGTAYIEFTDAWSTRQVEIYPSAIRWADEAHPEWLADQPLDETGLEEEHRIEPEEFEQVWSKVRP